MSQNYSNIIAPQDGSYQKLYEEYKEKYRATDAEAKEAESEVASLEGDISDFCTEHATITDNGTYNINEGNSFEVNVPDDASDYMTFTVTNTGEIAIGIFAPKKVEEGEEKYSTLFNTIEAGESSTFYCYGNAGIDGVFIWKDNPTDTITFDGEAQETDTTDYGVYMSVTGDFSVERVQASDE